MSSNNIYAIAIIILFSPLLGKLIKSSIDFYKLSKIYKRGNKLLDLLNRLTPREFEIWASEYLSSLGYSNIVISPHESSDDKKIICTRDNKTYYVECSRSTLSTHISPKDVEKLLGLLIYDNISNGVIITTNSISEDTDTFLKRITAPYNIEIISLTSEECYYDDYLLGIN